MTQDLSGIGVVTYPGWGSQNLRLGIVKKVLKQQLKTESMIMLKYNLTTS